MQRALGIHLCNKQEVPGSMLGAQHTSGRQPACSHPLPHPPAGSQGMHSQGFTKQSQNPTSTEGIRTAVGPRNIYIFFEDCCLARHCQVCYLCCLCPFHTLLWGGYLMKHTLQTDTLRLREAGLPGWGHKTKPRAFIDPAHTCLWIGLCSEGRQTVVSQTDLPLCSQER